MNNISPLPLNAAPLTPPTTRPQKSLPYQFNLLAVIVLTAVVTSENTLAVNRIPWAVVFFAIILLNFAHRDIFHRFIRALFSGWSVGVLGYVLLNAVTASPWRYGAMLLPVLYLVGLVVVSHKKPKHLNLCAYFLMGYLILSGLMFLLRYNRVEWANVLFYMIWEESTTNNRSNLTGLIDTLALYGYQVAVMVPLGFGLLTASKTKLHFIVSLVVLVYSIWILLLTGERSPLLGSVVALLWIAWMSNSKIIKRGIFLTVICVGLVILNLDTIAHAFGLHEFSLVSRISEGTDNDWRSELQKRALVVILENPIGLYFSEYNWEDYASDLFLYGFYVTAHNAYLVQIVEMGWLAGLWFAVVMGVSLYKFYQDLSWYRTLNPDDYHLWVGISGSFISVLINAAFHNNSLFLLNGISWVIYCMMWIWHEHIQTLRKAYEENEREGKSGDLSAKALQQGS